MRGGAIPLLAWGTLLLVLYALNWIWEGRAIQVATTVFAIVAIYSIAAGLWLLRREALRRGPPPADPEPDALAQSSTGAVLVGLSVPCILFGMVWARFLVYFGAALLVAALGRSAVELRDQRAARAAAKRELPR